MFHWKRTQIRRPCRFQRLNTRWAKRICGLFSSAMSPPCPIDLRFQNTGIQFGPGISRWLDCFCIGSSSSLQCNLQAERDASWDRDRSICPGRRTSIASRQVRGMPCSALFSARVVSNWCRSRVRRPAPAPKDAVRPNVPMSTRRHGTGSGEASVIINMMHSSRNLQNFVAINDEYKLS